MDNERFNEYNEYYKRFNEHVNALKKRHTRVTVYVCSVLGVISAGLMGYGVITSKNTKERNDKEREACEHSYVCYEKAEKKISDANVIYGTTKLDTNNNFTKEYDIMTISYERGLTLILRDTDSDGVLNSIEAQFEKDKAQELYDFMKTDIKKFK